MPKKSLWERIDRHLSHKFIFVVSVCLFSLSLVFLVFLVQHYHYHLTAERAAASASVNYLLQAALENAMLKRDLDGLRAILGGLGQQPNIRQAFIANPRLEIRFSSDPAALGRFLQDSSEPGLWQVAQERLAQGPFTQFLRDEQGNEVLRSVNPVRNQARCSGCHGPPDSRPINGILFVDYDAAPIRQRALQNTLLLVGAGGITVLVAVLIIGVFISRLVLRPVAELASASRALAFGDLSRRATVHQRDELGLLATGFNRMADHLQETMLAIQERDEFLQALIDAIPEGIRVIDGRYRIVQANRVYAEMLGQPQPAGRYCYASSQRRDTPCPSTLVICPLTEIQKTAQPIKFMGEFRDSEGLPLPVEVCAAPMHITRQGEPEMLIVEATRDLRQVVDFSHEQRLSSIGQLAVGVAHEIYNPLSSIRLALQSTLRSLRAPDPDLAEVISYLELVDHQIDQSLLITQRLLRLSSANSEHPQLLDLNELLEETLALLNFESQQQAIKLCTDFVAGESYRVLAVESDLRMLLLNLLQNAFHAMPAGGTVTVSLRLAAPFLAIGVSDTGVAIPEEVLSKIFDPFFTQRADGKRGTGLGLAICKSIVERYQGRIEARNNPDCGARFDVYLPDARHVLGQG